MALPSILIILSYPIQIKAFFYSTKAETLPDVSSPTGNLSFNVKKGRKNMSDKYFTVNTYLDKDEDI